MNETNKIEYKLEFTSDTDIEKEVIAFLNYKEGGFVYIGIDKDGDVVGVDNVDDCMLKIKDRLKNNISPSALGLFDISQEYCCGVKIIKITIASGLQKPYYKTKYGMTSKGCFIRVGTAAEPMSQTLIEKQFARRVRNSIGEITSSRQELTFAQLRIYYEEKGIGLNDNFIKTLDLYNSEGKFNYFANLLSDNSNVSFKVAKYSSIDRVDLIENNEYGYCSIIKATNNIISKFEVENSIAAEITYPERIETPKWNKNALREAIINAIVHNDYTYEVPPKFEIFPDRLEITSFGSIPESLTIEEFFTGISIPRNRELMRVFRDLELVESLGSGIPRILKAYSRDCFVFMENFTRIILPMDKSYVKTTQKTAQKTAQKTTQKTDDKIVEIIKDNPCISRKQLSKLCGISQDGIKWQLKNLQKENKIRRVGPDKGGYWEVVD